VPGVLLWKQKELYGIGLISIITRPIRFADSASLVSEANEQGIKYTGMLWFDEIWKNNSHTNTDNSGVDSFLLSPNRFQRIRWIMMPPMAKKAMTAPHGPIHGRMIICLARYSMVNCTA